MVNSFFLGGSSPHKHYFSQLNLLFNQVCECTGACVGLCGYVCVCLQLCMFVVSEWVYIYSDCLLHCSQILCLCSSLSHTFTLLYAF